MKRCYALDLIDDPALISQYEEMHHTVWPEIIRSIRNSGIQEMEIFRVGNRLFMIMETKVDFSPEKRRESDQSNPEVQKWEELMWKYQQRLPFADPGEKWVEMKNIFTLSKQP